MGPRALTGGPLTPACLPFRATSSVAAIQSERLRARPTVPHREQGASFCPNEGSESGQPAMRRIRQSRDRTCEKHRRRQPAAFLQRLGTSPPPADTLTRALPPAMSRPNRQPKRGYRSPRPIDRHVPSQRHRVRPTGENRASKAAGGRSQISRPHQSRFPPANLTRAHPLAQDPVCSRSTPTTSSLTPPAGSYPYLLSPPHPTTETTSGSTPESQDLPTNRSGAMRMKDHLFPRTPPPRAPATVAVSFHRTSPTSDAPHSRAIALAERH